MPTSKDGDEIDLALVAQKSKIAAAYKMEAKRRTKERYRILLIQDRPKIIW